MTARVINLRAARKTAARDAARKQGAENAVKFGRTKAQKALELHESARAKTLLSGHHLGRDDSDGKGRDD